MNIVLPAMGEGVIEATINKCLVEAGTQVKEDDPLVEVATDKVDSEIPAPMDGILVDGFKDDIAIHNPRLELVAVFQPQLFAQRFGQHHLALGG